MRVSADSVVRLMLGLLLGDYLMRIEVRHLRIVLGADLRSDRCMLACKAMNNAGCKFLMIECSSDLVVLMLRALHVGDLYVGRSRASYRSLARDD